jgi:hypothetical protein
MKPRDVKDFASTKHDKLPEKVSEHHLSTKEEKIQFIEKHVGDVIKDIGRVLQKLSDDAIDVIYTSLEKELGMIDEATNMSMIDSNPTTMANKPEPVGDQGSNLDRGVGGISEHHLNTKEEKIQYIVDVLYLLPETLQSVIIALAKTNALTSEIVNYLDSLEDVDKRSEVKKADPDAFKNVGNSTNEKGDEIPKRNHTDEEIDEIDIMRKGQQSLKYDTDPGKRFKDRMEKDMGERMTKIREKQLDVDANMPMYNKDTQPVSDGDKKAQYKKEKSDWNKNVASIKETMMTGKYSDDVGKNKFVNFYLHEVSESEEIRDGWKKLNIDGLGNISTNRFELNEGVDFLLKEYDYYLSENKVYSVRKKQLSEEGGLSESLNKMKHLLSYNPNEFIRTDRVKKGRGF